MLVSLSSSACDEPDLQPLDARSEREALVGLPTDAPLALALETTAGPIRCRLFPARAPHAVAMFVGLARGRATWREPAHGALVTRPLYRDLAFFRAIPNALVQSGCPVGDGTGHPGYRIAVESGSDDRARLARPGALLLARYNPAPNRPDQHPPPVGQVIGSQFVITLTDMSHLAGQVTLIGACDDHDVVRRIAQLVAAHESVRLKGVRFPALSERL